MTSDEGRTPEGAPERSPKAGVGAASGVDGNGPKRFSVQRKIAIVARLLRGEAVGLTSCSHSAPVGGASNGGHREPSAQGRYQIAPELLGFRVSNFEQIWQRLAL